MARNSVIFENVGNGARTAVIIVYRRFDSISRAQLKRCKRIRKSYSSGFVFVIGNRRV